VAANTCAVCDAPISHRLLMCHGHWHMVPAELQRRVYCAWWALQRHGGDRANFPQLETAYQGARDEAVLVVARMLAGSDA
jgi:hypothetical protein